MQGFGQDLRFAMRQLIKNPGFGAIVILALAVGIGANTAMFSMVNAVLLRPLPYPQPERLVALRSSQPDGSSSSPMSYPEFMAWKTQGDMFEEVAAYALSRSILTTEQGEPEQLSSMLVSANLLNLAGTTPSLGRIFRPEEDVPQGEPVVMISHLLWTSRFHSDPAIIGRKLRLTDREFSVIGVLPEEFNFGNSSPDVIIPLRLIVPIAPAGLKFLNVVGKLHPEVSARMASAALPVAVPQVKKLASDVQGAVIIPLKAYLTGDSPTLLWNLFGAMAFVLIIACANVANLLIARAVSREKEIAIRISLGAKRARLTRQLLTESILLATIGGVLGLVVASVSLKLMSSFLAQRLPRASEIHTDFYVLAFTALLSISAGVLFGLAPALHTLKGSLQQRLKQSGSQSSSSSGSQRLRQSLAVVEMIFSLVLLTGSGLLLRSFMRLLVVDKGFESDHVVTMTIQSSGLRFLDPRQEISYLQQILQQTQALPGIYAAGYITNLPLSGHDITGDVVIQGRPVDPRSPVVATKQFTGGDYFKTMRIPLIKGRYLNDSDTTDSPRVVVINQTFARRYFAEQEPIGHYIDVSWGAPGWSQVVGVVSDIKQGSLSTPAEPTFYAPLSQKPELLRMLEFSLTVHTGTSPSTVAPAIISKIRELDKGQALSKAQTMDQIVSDSLAARRVSMWVLGMFSAVGVFLTAIGIYGVLSYYVLQRRQEIGLRMALGSQRSQVLRLILGHAIKLIGTGVIAGLIVSSMVSQLMKRFLFDVKATDLSTLVGVSVILALLALLACTIPALRAARVDPWVALRSE